MKKAKLYTIPTSPNDVPVWKLQMLLTDESYSDETQPNERLLKTVTLLTDIPRDVAQAMPYATLEGLYEHLSETVIKPDLPIIHFWEHDGVKYGLDPDLESMPMGLFTDLNTYWGKHELYHLALAAMYRPVTKETKRLGHLYKVKPYRGARNVEEIFKEMPSGYVWGAHTFFLSLSMELKTISQHYILPDIRKKSQQQKDLRTQK